MNVQVIVTLCCAGEGGYRIYGERLHDDTFASLEAARLWGESAKDQGLSVLIRPNFNERDETGARFFREWRSFDGRPFQEIRWNI